MTQAAKPNPLFEIVITIIVPAVVLMKLSGEANLGPLSALLLALAFPVGWGLWDGLRRQACDAVAIAADADGGDGRQARPVTLAAAGGRTGRGGNLDLLRRRILSRRATRGRGIG